MSALIAVLVLALAGVVVHADGAVVQCTMSGTSGLVWLCNGVTYNLNTLQGPSGAKYGMR